MCRLSVLVALSALFSVPAAASTPRFADIMPISRVRAGMKGYGLTVFRGTKIEKFDVTVVGVVKKGSLLVPGHDMILVKMAGGPMTERQANLIRGMSGSPVYVNGKVIGAFSMGEPTTKEPLGGVTPIEDMLEAWDPKLPSSPLTSLPGRGIRIAELDPPLRARGREFRRVALNVPLKSGVRSHGDTLVLHPCTSLITLSANLSKAARQKLEQALEPYNVELVYGAQGGGNHYEGFKGAPLVPGAAFTMLLASGDLTLGGTGTVSYRKGNRILGFGHPMLGIGPIDAPMASAYIYDVYPLLAGSYKISSPGPIVGATTQDRNFSISGVIGRKPRTIPVTVEVRDQSIGRGRTFRAQAVGHPNLYAVITSMIVSSAVAEIRPTPGATMARITTTVDAEEIGKISRTNILFDRRSMDAAATADLDDLLSILTSNPFYPLGIKSAHVKIEMESGQRTAQVERIFLKEGRYEPGETVELGIVFKPYKQPSVTRFVTFSIPPGTPSGRHQIQVRGGAAPSAVSFGGLVFRPAPQANPEQAPPTSIRQMVNRYNDREKNNEVVARLVLPTTAVNVEGERLSSLPPSLDAIMRSSKSSGVRVERDEVKVVQPTEWVVSGQQTLQINVQRRDSRETPQGGSPQPQQPAFPQPGGGTGLSAPISGGIFEPEDDGYAFSTPIQTRRVESEPQKGQVSAPAPDPGATSAREAQPQSAAPDALSAEKPVARSATVWRQMSRSDFAAGTAQGVSVTTSGDLRLARSLKRVFTSTEGFLWSLIPDGQGGLFAGTGSQGKVLRIDAQGSSKVYAQLPEVAVHSLWLGADGVLWAGTGPNGRTYKITPDGKFTAAHQAKEKYALALAGDSRGNLFIGTGGGGAIYRLGSDGTASVHCRVPALHVLSLTADSQGNLYAGTAPDGLVYRITPEGEASVIYDAAEQSVTAVALRESGALYAVTAPKGVIYRIDPDSGVARTLFDKAPAAFTSVAAGPDNTLYAAAGSVVYAVSAADVVSALENKLDVDILSLTVAPDGTLYAGTGNVAEVYAAARPGASYSGSYDSVVHDAKQRSTWGAIRWNALIPEGTRVLVQTRTGNVAEPDNTWSEWSYAVPEADGGRVASPPGRFIQYRINLSTEREGVSPALRDIAISYMPKNQPPTVSFQAPAGGERWARNQTIRWQASDPDRDTLSYQLYYSRDNGATWEPLPEGSIAPGNAAPASAEQRAQPGANSDAAQAALDANPGLPAALREAIQNGSRGAGGQGAGSSGQPAAASRQSSRSFDTRALPDGPVIFKVAASDRPSNAVDPLTAEAVSEAVVICNTPPLLTIHGGRTAVQPDGSVTLEGTAVQTLIPIAAVQFRVDGGEWLAAAPADGLFDGRAERFIIKTPPLQKGARVIEVKAFSAANLVATEKVTVEVR